MLLLLLLAASLLALFIPVRFKDKPPKIPVSKKAFYVRYMQSSGWKIKRKERIKIDKGKCAKFHLFPMRKGLQVHHKNYDRLGNESMKDLTTLCNKHHTREHKK